MSEESTTEENEIEASPESEALKPEESVQDQEQGEDQASVDPSSPDDDEAADPDWQARYNEMNDTYLRAVAENENFKKRMLRDRQIEKATASKGAVMAMLPVVDNLERALNAVRSELKGAEAEGTLKQLFEGVELTLKSFESALQKLDVERVVCELEKPFDPNLHQALFQEENADLDEGSVLEVLQAGFSLGGQVIRPAMVKVSRKP